MSWFSELAGRAESLLDKMDQAAASSLQEAGLATTPKRNTPPPPASLSGSPLSYEPTAQPSSFSTSLGGSMSLTKPRVTSVASRSYSDRPSSGTRPAQSQGDNDQSIFEFLNSPSKPKESKQSGRAGTTKSAQTRSHQPISPVKMQPSSVSTISREQSQSSNEGGLKNWAEEQEVAEEKNTDTKDTISEPSDHPDAPLPTVETREDSGVDRPPEVKEPAPSEQVQVDIMALRQKVSNLELENKLLKREVASLNDELSGVMVRMREAGDSVNQYEGEMATLREQVLRADHMIRQLRSHEEDLEATLVAKDSQIQVLRTQLMETDKTADELKSQVAGTVRERERLLQDANLSSDAHNQALVSVKTQLAQTEALLKQERGEMAMIKVEFAERESHLQSEQQQLSQALAAQQRQMTMHQAKSAECQSALQSAHNELQLVRKEHDEYKQRAAGILQAKERLIASLQSGEGGPGAAKEAKLEEVRLEKEHLLAQLNSAQQQMENLKADIQEIEERHGNEVDQLLEQMRLSEESLEEERGTHTATKTELFQLSQEMVEQRDGFLREKTTLTAQLKDKETELESLRAKLSPGLGPSVGNRSELEGRLHELTESLIQKQTTIEALTSEKNSLNVQIQRLRNQLTDAQKLRPERAQTVVSGLGDDTAESARIRPMTSVLPSLDDRHLHRVKRAMNTVDRFSVRLGVFMRRYPYARLFALLYMVLLHVWVMVVLLTYKPEIHYKNMDNPL